MYIITSVNRTKGTDADQKDSAFAQIAGGQKKLASNISSGDAFEWHKSKPTKPGRLPCFQISLFLTEANFLRLVYNMLHTYMQQTYIQYILNGTCGYPWGVP